MIKLIHRLWRLSSDRRFSIVPVLLVCPLWLLLPDSASAHGSPPPSLQGVPVPATPGLLDGRQPIVTDKQAAILLGKALFWDVNVGSDGMACGSCHFHAGADRRVKNQLTTGSFHEGAVTATTFESTASGGAGGPNYVLNSADFPMHQLADPNDKSSSVLFTTDDVVGSAGVFSRSFQAVHKRGDGNDECNSTDDPVFHQGGLNTRRIAPRNAPTVINAAFNFRNFWDGRANNVFNGVSPFGPRDKKAGVWVVQEDGSVAKQRLRLENASLASQALGPPLNDIEMSCAQRAFPEVGRKLLKRRPLEQQEIHPQDSVLGDLRHTSGQGLDTTYAALIKQAFDRRYWSGNGDFGKADAAPYSQMEANFSLFFGVALQLYQQTLISDATPFDTPRDEAGIPTGLNARQKRGLTVFLNAHCALCHKGPTLSSAAHPDVYSVPSDTGLLLVNRKTLKGAESGSGVAFAVMDEGFANTSVSPYEHDPGIGGKDPFGNPLSYTEQYMQTLLGESGAMVDGVNIKACAMEVPFAMDYSSSDLVDDRFGKQGCSERDIYAQTPTAEVLRAELAKPDQGRALAAIAGAFKVPSLRNVELTGPYMHNGSMKSLEEVVDFYNRGGNFANQAHFGTLVFPQGFSQADKGDLVAFLKALTDERVRWERAPFDHPALSVPHGQTEKPALDNPAQAADRFLPVPAVGKAGRDPGQGPLKPFQAFLR
ncbi:MAG: conjugal transfer protein [Methylococcaceae bacterium]|nr:MAG: conjugal transfer protein [Methylococcaceae bacterium]